MQCHILDNIIYSGDTIYMTLELATFQLYSDVALEVQKKIREYVQKYGRAPVGVTVGVFEFMKLVEEYQATTNTQFIFRPENGIQFGGFKIRPSERPGITLEMDAEIAYVVSTFHPRSPRPEQPQV